MVRAKDQRMKRSMRSVRILKRLSIRRKPCSISLLLVFEFLLDPHHALALFQIEADHTGLS